MKRIMIDPGHGGSDSGAVNKIIKEKEINLIVANKLKDLLEIFGYKTAMTRHTDDFVSLDDRCIIANEWKADLFISIHHNASGSGADGYEVIHSIHGGKGKVFAELVGKEFESIGQNKRAIYSRESEHTSGKDYYRVIRGTNMPAAIMEFGFMDSNDYEAFDTQQELEKESEAIFKAVIRYFGGTIVEHWAEKPYRQLKNKGILIHEKRFDDNITRGEVFALLNQINK